jgi:hypothetical protein
MDGDCRFNGRRLLLQSLAAAVILYKRRHILLQVAYKVVCERQEEQENFHSMVVFSFFSFPEALTHLTVLTVRIERWRSGGSRI